MPFPPGAREDIDWSGPAVSLTRVNGHVQSRWSKKTGKWSEPEFVEDPFLRIHGLATVLHYGQEAYEGMKGELYDFSGAEAQYLYPSADYIKAFRGPDGEINIIRPDRHASRMRDSANLVSIQAVPEEHFLRCVQLVVGLNADLVPPHGINAMLYIRPFVFGSGPWFQLSPTDEYLFCVFVAPLGAYHGVQPLDALVIDQFDRAATRGVGGGKVGGNYAPVMQWSEKAKSEGFAITLHLDSQSQTEIEEFSTSGFVGIRRTGEENNTTTVIVVPDSKNVVDSVTSDSIQQLARSLGWCVEKRAIKYTELSNFSEVLAVGTGVTIVPIKSITRKSTSDRFIYHNESGETGPYGRLLGDLLDNIYKGKTEDKFKWLVQVKEPGANVPGSVNNKAP